MEAVHQQQLEMVTQQQAGLNDMSQLVSSVNDSIGRMDSLQSKFGTSAKASLENREALVSPTTQPPSHPLQPA